MEAPDFYNIFIVMLCYFGDSLAVDRFCKKYMGISKKREVLFLLLLIGSREVIGIIYIVYELPYIIFALVNHAVFATDAE